MKKIDVNLLLDLISRSKNKIPIWDESNHIYEREDTVSMYAHENSVLLESLLSYFILFKVCFRENCYLKFNPEILKRISLNDLFY